MDPHGPAASALDVRALLGEMDVYLVDQLLRGRIEPCMRILDAGCGGGRNLEYFLRAGYDAVGNDASQDAIARVRERARELGPGLDPPRLAERFRVEAVEDTSFEPDSVEVVVCNAVLHFARDHGHFRAMLDGAWRPLRKGGLFFARLASSIGLEARVRALGDGRFAVPDGTERYLVDEETLRRETARLGGRLADPLKTTNVDHRRCMTTWVVRREDGYTEARQA